MALRDTPAEQCTKTRPPPSTASAMKRYAFSQCWFILPCEPATDDSARAQQSKPVARARASNDRICSGDFELLTGLISVAARATLIKSSKCLFGSKKKCLFGSSTPSLSKCLFGSGFASRAGPKKGAEDSNQVTNRGRVVDGYAQIAETLREEILFVRCRVYWRTQRVCMRMCMCVCVYARAGLDSLAVSMCVRAHTRAHERFHSLADSELVLSEKSGQCCARTHASARTHTHTYRRV